MPAVQVAETKWTWGRIIRWVVVTGIVVGVLLPFIPLVVWSFSHRWYFPALVPTQWSLRAWRYVFSPGSQVPKALGYSTVIALAVTGLSILIGIPAGRAMGLHRFRGKTLVEFLILAPTIVPTIAVAMGIHVAFIKYGLADTLIGVILVHLIPVTPYMVMIMASVFANYDPEYEEQARTLGAGPIQTFIYVTFPAILPGLVVGGLFSFIISWSQYVLTLLIGGGRVITLPLLLFSFAGSGDNSITAALSMVFVAPAVLFLIVTSRYLTGENAAIGGFGKI
ncbi:MAG TPA: ABC transporter permease [Anaerolineae bacterium]|nr:ABC transporter permease [Anaerolineae bacterium]HIQ05808.1 ABC transporter permease [Anaerolineae bacterium]